MKYSITYYTPPEFLVSPAVSQAEFLVWGALSHEKAGTAIGVLLLIQYSTSTTIIQVVVVCCSTSEWTKQNRQTAAV